MSLMLLMKREINSTLIKRISEHVLITGNEKGGDSLPFETR